jgi:hypothetical protein
MMQIILSIRVILFLYFNELKKSFTPTQLSISLFYLLYSMAYFPAKRKYHEKYHAQKILQNARNAPIERFRTTPLATF